eukprot:jgi/Bigna1/85721/estExt_fgenesh1_pg.C_50336
MSFTFTSKDAFPIPPVAVAAEANDLLFPNSAVGSTENRCCRGWGGDDWAANDECFGDDDKEEEGGKARRLVLLNIITCERAIRRIRIAGKKRGEAPMEKQRLPNIRVAVEISCCGDQEPSPSRQTRKEKDGIPAETAEEPGGDRPHAYAPSNEGGWEFTNPSEGWIALFAQVQQMPYKPPATLFIMGVNIAVHLNDTLIPFSISSVCLHPAQILFGWDLKRLVLSAFVHADDYHLYYNMSSLLWKGAQLEQTNGTEEFLKMSAFLLLGSHVIYVLVAWILSMLGVFSATMQTCAVCRNRSGYIHPRLVILDVLSSRPAKRLDTLRCYSATRWSLTITRPV